MTAPELPYNLEAETATLGSLILNRDAIVAVDSWLTDRMFYLEKHGQIYAAIQALYRKRTPPDYRTIADELKRREQFEQVGGLDTLLSLTEQVATSYHVEHYAREVERCAVLRQIISAGSTITRIGYQYDLGADEAIGSAQQAIAKLALRSSGSGLVSFSTLADRQYEWLNAGVTPGIPTGFRDLDDYIGGLHTSDLLLLAARPAVGKTSLLLALAYNIAKQESHDVLIFSLEMSRDQLMQRAAAMEARIDLMRLRTMRLNEQELDRYMTALLTLSQLPVFVDDTAASTVSAMRSKASRHLAERGRPLVIFVDYVGLVTAPAQKGQNRVQEIGAISRGLKALAKELDCPVMTLAQLSRSVEGRQSHVPMLSDLRESGDLEQDADIVIFIYREELYDPDTDKKGTAELHIAKHRNGPIGVVPLRFDASTTTFSDLSYRTPEGY
jgi:replicative DNA helicase